MAGYRLYTFVVEGTGQFPWDMLRYDQCWPNSQQSATNMPVLRPIGFNTRRQVTLTGIKPATVKRWESFGWKVVT